MSVSNLCSVMTTICTGLTPRWYQNRLCIPVLENSGALADNLLTTKCRFKSSLVAPQTCKQLIQLHLGCAHVGQLMIGRCISTHPSKVVGRVSYISTRTRINVWRKSPVPHPLANINKVWRWINHNFMYERFSFLFLCTSLMIVLNMSVPNSEIIHTHTQVSLKTPDKILWLSFLFNFCCVLIIFFNVLTMFGK